MTWSVLFRGLPMLLGAATLLSIGGCPDDPDANGNDNQNDNSGGRPNATLWSRPFDESGAGALSSVWGSSPDDVFVVGGVPAQGEIYHFDGRAWTEMNAPNVGLLVWAFGFGPDDVFAVGVDGAAAHWDGQTWRALNPGTDADLWGVWGTAPDDLWIVGGVTGVGPPILLHYDGENFEPFEIPENDRNATSLFKVWGIGSKIFAVGERGLIIEFDGSTWKQTPAGALADEDFVSLWGVSESQIVAVGGRSGARIALYDGQKWETIAPTGTPGLNGVFMVSPDLCVVGGQAGYVGAFNPQTRALTREDADSNLDVHAVWGDGESTVYAVGGRFAPPFSGLALLRSTRAVPTAGVPAPGNNRVDNSALDNPPVGGGPEKDCNENKLEDAADIAAGRSQDCDGDGVPDECQDDADGDGVIDPCDECAAGNDAADADGDGVADACDVCPGGNDTRDDDKDTVPNACDICPGFNDTRDDDGDGVPNGCDRCKQGDDGQDADGDGTPDACDQCPGFNDELDADGDGVPNGCDTCVAGEIDTDGDGTPDACDICPGSDDRQDADGDGAPDGCDRCPGFDDNTDSDGDGVPDGCDLCPGSPDNQDADGDGVPNGCDVCAGFDDADDADNDGTPDACDACPNDATDDSDGDGVCDSADECPGSDDNVDCNQNGTPDGCECFVTDCPLGQDCDAQGNCAPVAADMRVQEAVLDPNFPDFPVIIGYQDVLECGDHKITCGIQGFADEQIQLWLSGFAQGTRVNITHSLVQLENCPDLNSDGTPDCDLAPQANFNNFPLIFDAASGLHRFELGRTIFRSPTLFNGQRARLRVTFTDRNDASITTTVTLHVRLVQDGPACP